MIARYIRPSVKAVSLFRYWKAAGGDHFYTTNFRELGRGRLGYRYEGVQCYIFPRVVRGTVPLYRYWNPGIVDHFYTTNFRELGRGRSGWRYEGIQGFVLPRRVRGSVPLYRYWNPSIGDHFYTTNFRELGRGAKGWRYEGVQCFVFPRPVAMAPSAEEGMEQSLTPEAGLGEYYESAETQGIMDVGQQADEMTRDMGQGESEVVSSVLQRMGITGFEQYIPSLDPNAQASNYPDAYFDDVLETDFGTEGSLLTPADLVEMGSDMFSPEALEPGLLETPTPEVMGADSFTVEPTSESDIEQIATADSFTTAAESEGLAPQDSFSTSEKQGEQGNITVNLNLGKK
jgi:hypothetical protein